MWSEATRVEVSRQLDAHLTESNQFLALARAMLDGHLPPDLPLLLYAYGRGVCSCFDHLHHAARDLIGAVAERQGLLPADGLLFDAGHGLSREAAAALCPDLLPNLYGASTSDALDRLPLLEGCGNEIANRRFPPPMNMLLHRADRPPMHAYVSNDACVYAHPFRYQVLSRDRSRSWASGSPRGLSRDAIGATEIIALDKDIIVLQDRFNFTALSHFLFDGITRALLLGQALGNLRSSLLVFGGIPDEMHASICNALCEMLNLEPENILFPDHSVTLETTGRCIWFSDQVEAYLHPAQMAHPTSIALLRSIVEALPGAPVECRRVYLRGSAAGHTRVANEEALIARLGQSGFTPLRLAELTARQRIGLFREADLVVAPYGLDLTYLIAADRARGVVELLSPLGGTDTYAFIAAAGHIPHVGIVGDGDAAGLTVNEAQVGRFTEFLAAGAGRPVWGGPANLLAGSRWPTRLAGSSDAGGDRQSIPPLIAGNAVINHGAVTGGAGAVVGRWPAIELIVGLRYTASCWIWLPSDFAGSAVTLHLTQAADPEITAADPTRRGSWQRVSTTATPLAVGSDIELRIEASRETSCASTCWQLERGDVATTYVATP
ncbi:MAG: glycosyltransferase family 61 protein [Alphaproteobacteria bacterium]|nr:glycosyltransferase family 61 protein [Alphaproteobacteria bacterium]